MSAAGHAWGSTSAIIPGRTESTLQYLWFYLVCVEFDMEWLVPFGYFQWKTYTVRDRIFLHEVVR